MVLPILNSDGKGLCGVLEIVGYSPMPKEGYLEDRYLADFISYCLGILIENYKKQERESRDMTTNTHIMDAFFKIIEVEQPYQLVYEVQRFVAKIFGLQPEDCSFLLADREANMIKYERKETDKEVIIQKKVIPFGSGICGDVLCTTQKAEIVLAPSQDVRFNVKVDMDTTIPIIVFPVLKYDVVKRQFRYYGVVQFITRFLGYSGHKLRTDFEGYQLQIDDWIKSVIEKFSSVIIRQMDKLNGDYGSDLGDEEEDIVSKHSKNVEQE